MDENKLEKLRQLNYTIYRCCGICKHAEFAESDWSICLVHEYNHLKHSENVRHLSVNRYGHCNDFNIGPVAVMSLNKWSEFIK